MRKKFNWTMGGTQMRKSRGYSKILKAMLSLVLLLVIFTAGCKKDNFQGEVKGLCSIVASTDPMDKAVDVVLDKVISVTFNTSMKSATINNTTFIIKQGSKLISGTVAPTANGAIFTFKPDSALAPFTTYTGTITTGATDTLRTALVNDNVWSFTTIPQITLSSSPAAGGTSTGAGTFAQGSVVTVVATPNTGYTFTNWTENGTVASVSPSYQFTMSGNRTLVANFAPVKAGNFAVTLLSNPAAGGTTMGSGSYVAGSSVTVTASANAGYTFVNWTENGNIASTSSSYTFPLNANRTLVANYRIIPASQFAVILSSNPAAGGSTNGSGAYTAGSSVTVTASANAGYTFVSWTDNGTIASTSSSYTFPLSANRTLVANFTINTYTVTLSSNPAAGGTTTGAGSFNAGSSVTVTASANNGYTFVNWTENGNIASTSSSYTFPLNANRALVANFAANTYTLNVTSANGTVVKNPNQATYNNGTTVQLTATPNPGYTFTSWSGDATGSVNPLTVTMNANKNITANYTPTVAIGPGQVNLGTAGDFSILTKSGISTTGITSVAGDIGVSPAAATAITGFGLIMDTNGQSSHTPIVTGKVYASDYAAPTPAKMTTAVNDMETAFTTANGLTTPAPIVDLYNGDISGRTLPPGLYKWGTGVLISNAGVTLSGGPNDTWVFQISQDLIVNNSAIVTLLGGAQAKNIFWVVSGQANLGTNTDFSGIILSKTLISLNTGAKVTGKLLAQTAVTLNASTVVQP